MASSAVRGRFVWHELLTTDPDAAVGFYDKVVGWKVMTWEQDPSYRMFTWNGKPLTGLMPLPEEAKAMGAPPNWLTYVEVNDVDSAVRQALSLGAKTLVEPMSVPTVGRMAVMMDPQGAAFAVYRPEMPAPDLGDKNTIGDFSWHELATTDWKAAWDFYRAMFGWEYESQMDMGEMGTYWMYRRAGGKQALGGFYNKPPQMPMPNWMPYIFVPSADRAADAAKRAGGKVLNGPMDVPGGGRIAQLMDPQGAAIAVHSAAPKVAAAPKPKPAATVASKKSPTVAVASKKSPTVASKKSPKAAVKKKPAKKAAPKEKAAKGKPVKKAAKRKR